ncbi:DUF6328 family protein [uncultured Cellulomonas sp.]|uniref:DUF6328 family protein n=1 Tax=uncultured Cellulomonas sp. TaxID=189682 RepID=UPI0026165C4B|nr:DUF6328 family protein [uncultured Cellulomonas sp.]
MAETDDVDGHPDEQRRRYRELLEELRTVFPGAQVLFAFLLTVPFSARFDELDAVGTQIFALALVSVGLATVVLLAPAAYNRLTPRHDRGPRIKLGVRVAVVGMMPLAVAVGSSVFVVGRLVFQTNSVPPSGDLSQPRSVPSSRPSSGEQRSSCGSSFRSRDATADSVGCAVVCV